MNIIGWPVICRPNQPMIFAKVFDKVLYLNIHLYMIWPKVKKVHHAMSMRIDIPGITLKSLNLKTKSYTVTTYIWCLAFAVCLEYGKERKLEFKVI